MKHFAQIIVFAPLLFLFSGCPSVPRPAPVKGPAFSQLAGDTLEHAASGLRFPAMVGDLKRVGTNQYDNSGLNVSAGYNLYSQGVAAAAVTIYIYPSPALRSFGSPQSVIDNAGNVLAQSLYQSTKKEIMDAHPGGKLLAENACPPANQASQPQGMHAQFSYKENFAGAVGPVESHLYLYSYVNKRWSIKYRVSFPEGSGADTREKVEQFMKEFQWTGVK